VPDGKAVDVGQSASHVGCISNRQATRSDDESRSVGEGRAQHDDDEERPRRLAVAPSMLSYARSISCRIASSRRRTMSAAAGRVADPKKKSSATMRHERCWTAKPSTRGKMRATSAAFRAASDSKRWRESQRRRGSSSSRRRIKAPTARDGGTVDARLYQGISCRIASSRRRTMSAAAGRVADPKKSSATMRHERCWTAKPSTRGKMLATSAAFHTASDSERWQESQRRRGSSPSRRR
jgi:hypothetical protein